MNKKILLLFTFFISFMVSIDIAQAAEKMTCTYDYDPRGINTSGFDTITIEQTKKGNISIKINSKSTKHYNKNSLVDPDKFIENGVLKKCPPCAQFTKGYKITLTNVGSDKKCAAYRSGDNPVLAGRNTNFTKWSKKCKYTYQNNKNKMVEIDYNKYNFQVNSDKYAIEKYVAYDHSNEIKKARPGFTMPELIKVAYVNKEPKCPESIFVLKNSGNLGLITFNGCNSVNGCEAEKLTLYDSKKAKEINSDDYKIKELNCSGYENSGPYVTIKYKIKQEEDTGKRTYYMATDNSEYVKQPIKDEDYNNTSVLIETKDGKKVLDECPKCFKIDGSKAIGSDESGMSENGNVDGFICQTSSGYKASNQDDTDSSDDSDEDEKLTCDEDWDMVCKYGNNDDHSKIITLKFNDKGYKFNAWHDESSTDLSNLNLEDILKISEGKCPQNIYSKIIESSNTGSVGVADGSVKKETFYLADNKTGTNTIYTPIKRLDCNENPSKVQTWEINTCEDLFGKDLIEIIDNVMKYIRILVPVLLLIYGTTDFFTAVFSSDEETMVSKRKRFFKRLIAAAIVFIVPIFVNLVLKLGNMVWNDIHDDTCIRDGDNY